jgi:hypothetical protein
MAQNNHQNVAIRDRTTHIAMKTKRNLPNVTMEGAKARVVHKRTFPRGDHIILKRLPPIIVSEDTPDFSIAG